MTEATPISGPLVVYRAMLQRGELAADPSQELAIEKLQALHLQLTRLQSEQTSMADNGRGWRRWFQFNDRHTSPVPVGLYIYGDVGRGKSMLMDLFFEAAPVTAKRRVHFHRFMMDVHQAAHEFRQTPKAERDGDDPIPPIAREVAEQARLLCFDEFQVTDVADAMILGRLFSQLFELGVVVVATSNRPPDDLYLGGLNRELFLPFIALFKEKLDLLHLAGPTDYRMARLSRMPVYHTPLDGAADAAFDQAFRDLTEGEPATATTLTVGGRDLTLAKTAIGVAAATFAELCEQPLGAADYLALAEKFHTLLLRGIPKMGPERRNEAKRLATLIDVLYENRVKLICTAAADPEHLYPAGDGSFEFARTASRLVEMQSSEYLAEPHQLR